ncbi:hypothetical protein AB0K00_33290 [Dactylosporangium sp. NPDC049525]|uniref:hypothetical protein n=1 Tax=Dactylosporangium sp. NPDC049525 TaxID=3154730 RepID=UPI00342B6CB3
MSAPQQPTVLGTPAWIRLRPEDLQNEPAAARGAYEPTVLVDIDLRDLKATPEVEDDGELVLTVYDRDSLIIFQPGAGASPQAAVAGARALAAAALHYAELLAIRFRGNLPDPDPRTEPTDAARVRSLSSEGRHEGAAGR